MKHRNEFSRARHNRFFFFRTGSNKRPLSPLASFELLSVVDDEPAKNQLKRKQLYRHFQNGDSGRAEKWYAAHKLSLNVSFLLSSFL